ncbi:MAG: FKBP-type peptidyl-prolyl cis-trans isomerase, partial [Methanobacteriota archaeon]
MARRLARDDAALSNLAVLALILVAVAMISAGWFYFFLPRPVEEPLLAQDGDRVAVNYIGYFQDTNLVFDTSLESIAEDNATWPKAFSFSFRGTWQTYGFRLGDPTDAQRPVRGFEDGIRRMAKGETRVILVPPEEGYGAMDPTKVVVRPVLESVPVRLTVNATEFQALYGTTPASGAHVTDPFWGWDAIVEVAGSVVSVTNSPEIG